MVAKTHVAVDPVGQRDGNSNRLVSISASHDTFWQTQILIGLDVPKGITYISLAAPGIWERNRVFGIGAQHVRVRECVCVYVCVRW